MKKEKKYKQHLKDYFQERKIKTKLWDIINVEYQEHKIDIYARNIGLLIGKDGHRILDMETYFSEYYNKPVKINAIKHIEWYNAHP